MNKQWKLIEEVEALKKRELELLAVIEGLKEIIEAAENEEAEYYEELNRGYSQDRI